MAERMTLADELRQISHRETIKEMNMNMFILALRVTINPMDETLMRELCWEAANRFEALESQKRMSIADAIEYARNIIPKEDGDEVS